MCDVFIHLHAGAVVLLALAGGLVFRKRKRRALSDVEQKKVAKLAGPEGSSNDNDPEQSDRDLPDSGVERALVSAVSAGAAGTVAARQAVQQAPYSSTGSAKKGTGYDSGSLGSIDVSAWSFRNTTVEVSEPRRMDDKAQGSLTVRQRRGRLHILVTCSFYRHAHLYNSVCPQVNDLKLFVRMYLCDSRTCTPLTPLQWIPARNQPRLMT